jgi:hypothetical protein
MSLFWAGLGCLISLRAATVQEAQQVFVWAIIILVFGSTFGSSALPAQMRDRILSFLGQTQSIVLELLLAGIMIMFNIFLILLAKARFQRTRLVLD